MDMLEVLEAAQDGCVSKEEPKQEVIKIDPTVATVNLRFDGVDKVDRKLHVWLAKKMLAENPEIFTYHSTAGHTCKLLSIDEDGVLGKALVDKPNISLIHFHITLNERTVYYKDTVHIVTGDKWAIRVDVQHHLTDDQKRQMKEHAARVEALEAEHEASVKAKELAIANNTPKDWLGEEVEWPVLVSEKDIPMTTKYAGVEAALALGTPIYGWWEGEDYFSRGRILNPLERTPADFQLISIDRSSQKVLVKEYKPYPHLDKENHILAFAFTHTVSNWDSYTERKIESILGMFVMDIRPFLETVDVYQQQQEILKTL